MGYDLYGRRPSGPSGRDFHVHFLLWWPLWGFVCREADDILDKEEAFHGAFNEGQYIRAVKARALAERLTLLLEDGTVAREARTYAARAARERRKACPVCRGRGRRLDRTVRPPVRGQCWACDGRGRRKAHPRFRLEWVEEFRDFCRESGGFRID